MHPAAPLGFGAVFRTVNASTHMQEFEWMGLTLRAEELLQHLFERNLAGESACARYALLPFDRVGEGHRGVGFQPVVQALQVRVIAAVNDLVVFIPARDADEVC